MDASLGGLSYAIRWEACRARAWAPWVMPAEGRLSLVQDGRRLRLPVRHIVDDLLVVRGVFADQEYRIDPPTVPTRILDLGANCGFAAAYFSARWPGVELACVECSPANVQRLRETIRINGLRATAIAAAVQASPGLCLIDLPEGSPSCNAVVPGTTGFNVGALAVPGVTVDQVLDQMHWPTVDLVKMDIEGAEEELVTKNSGWLSRTNRLLFELHGWINGKAVLDKLWEAGFTVESLNRSGEQTYHAFR